MQALLASRSLEEHQKRDRYGIFSFLLPFFFFFGLLYFIFTFFKFFLWGGGCQAQVPVAYYTDLLLSGDAWKYTPTHEAAEVQGQPLITHLDRAFPLHVVHVRRALRGRPNALDWLFANISLSH